MQLRPLTYMVSPRTIVSFRSVAKPLLEMRVRFAATEEKPKSTLEKLRAWVMGTLLFVSGVSTGVVGDRTYDYLTTPNPHRVVAVADGDTFTLANKEKVRIYGIDAPEKGQPFYEASQAFLASLIDGRVMTLKYKRNSFDRKVYEVYVGSVDVGAEMVRNGYAFAEEKYAQGGYKAAEAEAKAHKRGVWTLPEGGERPWEYRKRK